MKCVNVIIDVEETGASCHSSVISPDFPLHLTSNELSWNNFCVLCDICDIFAAP